MGEDLQEHTDTGDLSPVTMVTSALSPKRPVMDKLRLREAEMKRDEKEEDGEEAQSTEVKVLTGSFSVNYRK